MSYSHNPNMVSLTNKYNKKNINDRRVRLKTSMDNYGDKLRIKELPPVLEGSLKTEYEQISNKWWENPQPIKGNV